MTEGCAAISKTTFIQRLGYKKACLAKEKAQKSLESTKNGWKERGTEQSKAGYSRAEQTKKIPFPGLELSIRAQKAIRGPSPRAVINISMYSEGLSSLKVPADLMQSCSKDLTTLEDR